MTAQQENKGYETPMFTPMFIWRITTFCAGTLSVMLGAGFVWGLPGLIVGGGACLVAFSLLMEAP